MVDSNVVEEATGHDEIGLRGFNFSLFDKDEKGVGREGSSEFSYLIILIKLWPGNWDTQLKIMNQKVDEKWESIGKREWTVLKILLVFQN